MTIVGHVYASHPSMRFMLGDLVSTDWQRNGRTTVHRIVAIQRCVPNSQTGTLFLVEPPVHKPDRNRRSNPYAGAGDWIDCAWFFKEGIEVL
jgi:hypothetical protein